jgi:hypothetical protein
MPLPDKGETQDDFIARFMSDERMKQRYPNKTQRLAVAYQHWKEKSKKKS